MSGYPTRIGGRPVDGVKIETQTRIAWRTKCCDEFASTGWIETTGRWTVRCIIDCPRCSRPYVLDKQLKPQIHGE